MVTVDSSTLHLGYTDEERAVSPYAAFYRPEMAPVLPHVQEALLTGGVSAELMWPRSHALHLQQAGYEAVETGYACAPDGSAHVNVLTPMPGVAPAMWDWWFAWHGSDVQRYKLWHPRAHLSARWQDGRGDMNHYIGRTSRVAEYLGSRLMHLTIRFVAPSTLGLDEQRLHAQGEVAICARCGFDGVPLETGWLVHHLRPTADGCEMRSRFWIGGRHVGLRGGGPLGQGLGRMAAWAARYVQPISDAQAADLLVHCAQEMQHLAGILPALYAAFGPDAALKVAQSCDRVGPKWGTA